MSDKALIERCEQTAATAQEALAWVTDPKNDPRVGHERAFLERSLRSSAYQARRLARSVDRPMCIGVFGPSQAGKSYLVSVLARKGDALMALFDDAARPEIDFIKDINPYGEKEATGLVTRFSIHKVATPKGFPVALRLLTQTDILKILANSYFFDGDMQEEQGLSPQDVDAHIAGFEKRAGTALADVLREEDIWDVEEYFQRQIRRTEAKVFAPFWDRMAHVAPRLSLADRAELFSILWGRHKELTALYLLLLEALAKIDFAEEAFCPLEALVPATTGILNVETLAGLGQPGADTFNVSGNGKVVALPRPVVTALAAELRMVLKDTPWPFFEHTDLLDFPGYRSRTAHNLGKYLREAQGNALKELFLRGKVDYLFQRYTAEQELTSMLLCIGPSNLEVTTLPTVIEDWIGVTHGRSAADRQGRPILLFFLLTKFDQHLSEKAGDEATDPSLRFESRLEASLLKPFAKVADSWPLNWTPGETFKNCYWIRNPNYKAEGIIQYEGRSETRVHDHKVGRIAELRAASVRAPQVTAHFRDAARAFDEVMRLNDGGISYLAEALALVCKPGMKQAQVNARLEDLRRRVLQSLSPHFIATDAVARLAERTAIAEAVIEDFEECVQRSMFGVFQRALCLDRMQLADALYEARTRTRAEGNGEAPAASAEAPRRTSSLLGAIKGGGGVSAPASAPPRARSQRTDQMARCAVETWAESMHDVSEDEDFASALGVKRGSLREVATELIAASRRIGLEGRIRTALDGVLHIESAEQAAGKATIIAERHINRFVTRLDDAPPARAALFDASGIGAQAENFQQESILAWFRAFYAHVQQNAQSVDGLVHDPQQNARLGSIIESLSLR